MNRRLVQEQANKILDSTTIEFIKDVVFERDAIYFKFDGEEYYYMPALALRVILIESKFTNAKDAFIDKLTNLDEFLFDVGTQRFYSEFVSEMQTSSQMKRRVQAHVDAIFATRTIELISTFGLNRKEGLIRFKFDGKEYHMATQMLSEILTGVENSEAGNAFIDKLTNLDAFMNSAGIKEFLPELTGAL